MAEQKKKTGGGSGSGNKGKRSAAKKPVKTGSRVKDEIFAIIIIAVGVFLAIAIQTSAAGELGKLLQEFLLGCFGIIAYVLPYYLVLYGILLMLEKMVHITGRSFLLTLVIFLMLSLLNSARYVDPETFSFAWKDCMEVFAQAVLKENGGLVGMVLGTLIAKLIGVPGLTIFSAVVIVVCLLLVTNTPITQFLENSRIRRAERQEEREREAEEHARRQQEREIEQRIENKYAMMERQKNDQPAPESDLHNDGAEGEISSAAREDAEIKPKKKGFWSSLFGVGDTDEDGAEAAGTKEKDERAGDDKKSVYATAKIAKNQQNILSYMNDDSLFSSGEAGRFSDDLTEDVGQTNEAAPAAAAQTVKKLSKSEAANAALSEGELNMNADNKPKQYKFPPLDLLNKSKGENKNADNVLREKAIKLEETLKNFHVDAKVVDVTQGPAVTRYEIQPAVGVKVASIVRLADDIALNLEAKSIRIEAPIPGKAAVGIEVENDNINFVNLRDIIGSKEFKEAKSRISFAVGKDISGNAIVGDLKSMPHMLIAGSTGSGKSVCVNSIILSILYKAKPEEVKLVLIDPKVVELGNYNGIPHLLIPVVTEPGKAAAALNWAVAEMTDRYKKFAEEGVRDLESYNELVKANGEEDKYLPQIVVIIDELADLMMAAPSQVEESICRLAQMARAAGMHLIVATQRPSVDVVTGVIKANIPSRIAFAVSSQVDSRTIIDMGGAEKLVGKGDMLYSPIGIGKPLRVQGAFVSDAEVNKVIEHVKAQASEAEYSEDVLYSIEKSNVQTDADDGDELLAEAIETVVHSGQASVSMLQRRFRIGYNRAARIVDMMEARGVIGPADGSRPRQVLMTEEELEALKNETSE